MKSSVVLLIMATIGLFSCGQDGKSESTADDAKASDSVESIKSQKSHEKYIYTKYEYVDSSGARLLIQNSFPKSGINYTASNGKNYVYAVFWTRIINETANPVELTLSFPTKSFEFPSSSGNYMKLLLPPDTMTTDKEAMFNYGLAVKSFLANGIPKSSSLKRIIYPNESSGFYVVPLSTHGVGGTLRTGLSLKGQNLIYKVNDKEIYSGKINLRNLLQK